MQAVSGPLWLRRPLPRPLPLGCPLPQSLRPPRHSRFCWSGEATLGLWVLICIRGPLPPAPPSRLPAPACLPRGRRHFPGRPELTSLSKPPVAGGQSSAVGEPGVGLPACCAVSGPQCLRAPELGGSACCGWAGGLVGTAWNLPRSSPALTLHEGPLLWSHACRLAFRRVDEMYLMRFVFCLLPANCPVAWLCSCTRGIHLHPVAGDPSSPPVAASPFRELGSLGLGASFLTW